MKIALVTGATAGIGRATALSLASDGYNLIITGRRSSLLDDLATELKEKFKISVLTLCFDVRSLPEVNKNLSSLPAEWQKISVLVNNAGLAVGLSSIDEGVIDDWERMIDTNIKGLLYVTKIVSGYMKKANQGQIINICSIAGKEVYSGGNVYCATKHAVDALTRSMMIDLHKYNIRVGQVCPGAVETEFSQVRFKGDMERASTVYKGYKPLTAEDIADVILFMVKAPAHVNISDVVVMPVAQASASIINRA